MIFDAFGRLALGQVTQNFGTATIHLGGVSASALVGVLGKSTGPQLSGISGSGSASGFTGGTTTTSGTPIGALLTITIGTTVTAGDGDKLVEPFPAGVAGTGARGVPFGSVAANLFGVQGFGVAGSLGNVRTPTVTGVAGASQLGTLTPTVTSFNFVGVEADGGAGSIIAQDAGLTLGGVAATGQAGTFNDGPYAGTIVVSGGGGKRPKTGLEPVKKVPQAPPEPVKIPTYVMPKFAPKLAPRAPQPVRTPFERAPDAMPLDLMKMKQEIQAAQDEADIKAVLAFLDTVD